MSAPEPPILNASRISKKYGENVVLDRISLEVHKGEVIALIGPSGAGKSTFLRCLNYLEHPTGGNLELDGAGVFADPLKPAKKELLDLRRRVGMVFQSFNLFPHMSVIKNITMAQVLNGNRPERAAREYGMDLLDSVGLSDKAAAKPMQCSGGQQQRIAIARALALDPEIMLFDEPTSALDPEVGNDVLGVMRNLADAGTTMIVVTHEMSFAAKVADRVLLLADGTIMEEGPPERVFGSPEHERTVRFLSAVMDR